MKRKNKLDKWFLLTWKKVWILVVSWFLAAILHNVFYAIFEIEEAFFFIIAIIVIPAYLIVTIIYSLVKRWRN